MRLSVPAGLWSALVVGLLLVAALPAAAVPSLQDPSAGPQPVAQQSSPTPSSPSSPTTTDSSTPATTTQTETATETTTESPTPSTTTTETATTTETTTTESPTPETTTESPTPETTTESPTPETTTETTTTETETTTTTTESPTPETTSTATETATETETETTAATATTTTATETETTTESPSPTTDAGDSGQTDGGDGDAGSSDGDRSADDEDDDRRRGRGKARQLGERLTVSIGAAGAGEFARAQRLVGENYTQTLSTYESLSNKQGATAAFAGAQTNQRSYIAIVREYETTRQQYRTAARNGNDSGTRQLSRKLTRLADASNLTASRLQQNYSGIEQRTSVSLDEASSTVEAGQTWIAEQQAQIEPAELTRTQLRASTDADSVSFLSPATVRGTLTAANGSPVANREVAFLVGGQEVTTTTDGSGGFSFDYRPTTVKQSVEQLTVEYVPEETAPYTRASTTLPVRIEQTNGRVSVSETPSNAAFGDEVTVTGRVAADGTPAASVPVEVSLGNTTLGTAETDADGRYSLTTRLPASVSAGDRQLTTALALQNRALTAESAAAGVSIASTATSLTLRVANASRQHVFVYGKLTTDEGTRVGGQQIQISVGDSVVGTAMTGSDGAYEANLSLSPEVSDAAESGDVSVQAVYEGRDTNLDPSRDSAAVPLGAGGESGGGGLGDLANSNLLLGAAGAAFLLLLLLAAWGILRFGATGVESDGDGDDPQDGDGDTDTETGANDSEAPERDDVDAVATDTPESTADSTQSERNQFSWSEVADGGETQPDDGTQSSAQQPVTFDDPNRSETLQQPGTTGPETTQNPPGPGTDGVRHRPDQQPVVEDTTTDAPAADANQQLAAARTALADGDHETAVNRAYETACEHVQTRYDFDAVDSLSASSPEAFFETCQSHDGIDEETLDHLDALTRQQDKALYGYGSVSEEEAEDAVSHARAVVDGGESNAPSR